MFLWARIFMGKEVIKENNITTFYSLNLGLFPSIKKHFEDCVSDTQIKIEYFWRIPNLEEV